MNVNSECDSTLSCEQRWRMTLSSNGETDDEDMEDQETGFDDGSALVSKFCVTQANVTVNSPHQEIRMTHTTIWKECTMCAMDCGCPWRRGNLKNR